MSWNLHASDFSPEFAIADSTSNETDPALALSTTSDRFLVTWSDDTPGANLRVRGAYVSSDTMTAGVPATLADHPSAHRYPANLAWEYW